jgi:hypothetical protein
VKTPANKTPPAESPSSSNTPPVSETVVVALGIPPKVSYLMAQIAHVNRVNKDGKRVFLIGCNYIGRARY